ncbi:hypothetical protein G7K_5811-t1 [Saitoella complicata NRRL Y-17804]|uniref:Uncharacterized protein n=1 Tax=Saitoella complicata (strain BCRC 22490 / CBS 7301 / JCM 7358 / NBRC 10748 / NRRL Y-17804) TaxID=698492 RepID=A0A0E9NPI9_SAICN|nr:hypothetical protein G7K_5811-t1 [Saitoella complicata NRRL Y-17804]
MLLRVHFPNRQPRNKVSGAGGALRSVNQFCNTPRSHQLTRGLPNPTHAGHPAKFPRSARTFVPPSRQLPYEQRLRVRLRLKQIRVFSFL